jgi:hypothetical protein
MLRKFQVTGTLHEEQFTFIISCPVLLKIRNFLDKIVEKMEEHISCSITFFPKIVPFMRYCGKTR